MHITRPKRDFIRRRYIAGHLNLPQLSYVLGLRRSTIALYIKEFKTIQDKHPEKLSDFDFYIGSEKVKKRTTWHINLIKILPELVAAERGPVIRASELYRKYSILCPGEFKPGRFYHLFRIWFKENADRISAKRLNEKFSSAELKTLKSWRKSNDRRRWQIAVTLMTVYSYHSFRELADKLECTTCTMRRWRNIYNTQGLSGLDRDGDKCPISPERAGEIEKKMDNLVYLVRQSPKNYGIDRASWFVSDLALAYQREFGQFIAQSTVSVYLKRRGIRYKRSREVIVSNDPDFKVKYAEIKRILSNLSETEKFFSIDEYGPCSIRAKGGRQLSLKGEQPNFKTVMKGIGYIICTCALELSTNQLIWFYSPKKNTEEMIRLIKVLSEKYYDQTTLYLSWDAATWHASKALLDYLKTIETQQPAIVLAPLPARAPHMNIIESVFSGMSKSVIRNSDYKTVAECQSAIDRYFNRRNQHYLDNPKQAGLKIWGKEKVKPVFNKANICKQL